LIQHDSAPVIVGVRSAFFGGGKNVLPDWQKMFRDYFQVYLMYLLIYFFYLEIDGDYFLIVADYEKIEKLDEQI
jgi:hypothetical protein